LDVSLIPELAAKKCIRKNLLFNGYGDIFTSNLTQDLDSVWEQWVRPLVVDLPSKGLVIRELKEIFKVEVGHSWDTSGQQSTKRGNFP